METLDPKAYLTLEELCEEVNRLRRRFPALAKTDAVTGRTVRFYVERELLVLPSLRPGPGKQYPYETVWKVLFIRLLSTKHRLPLNYLRETMQSVDAETMRRVVTGEEPLEIASRSDAEAVRRHATQGYRVVALTGVAEGGSVEDDWPVLVRTEDVVLKVREGVDAAKLKQLRHIAALIRTLGEDE